MKKPLRPLAIFVLTGSESALEALLISFKPVIATFTFTPKDRGPALQSAPFFI